MCYTAVSYSIPGHENRGINGQIQRPGVERRFASVIGENKGEKEVLKAGGPRSTAGGVEEVAMAGRGGDQLTWKRAEAEVSPQTGRLVSGPGEVRKGLCCRYNSRRWA